MSQLMRVVLGRFGRVCFRRLNKSLAPHSHEDFHLILSQDDQELIFRVGDTEVPVSADFAIAVDTWVSHSYERRDHGIASPIMALHLNPQWVAALDRKAKGGVIALFQGSPSLALDDDGRRRLDYLFQHLMFDNAPSSLKVERLIADLLHALSAAAAMSRGARQRLSAVPADARIRRALSVIHGWNGTDFALDELLSATKLSKARFFGLFKQETGLTPNAYYNTLRMERAIQQLVTSTQSLESIAADLGFECPANFTRFFRNQFGLAPSEYRKAAEVL